MKKRNGTPRGLIPDFGIIETIEAETEMQILVGEAALRESKKRNGDKDPFNCVIACAIELQGPKTYFKAVVFKKVTYIDQLCLDGKRRLVRYRNSQAMVGELSYYDRTGKWRKSAFDKPLALLKSPFPLAAMRKYNVQWRATVEPMYREQKKATEVLRTATADVEKARRRFEAVKDSSPPSAERYKTAKTQVAVAKENVAAARERFDAAKEAVAEYRLGSFYHGTGEAKPKKFDARVRSGVGALMKHRERLAA